MVPVIFDTVNTAFGGGKFDLLPAEERGNPRTGEILTCWELSPEELEIIQKTGKIWLSVLTYGRNVQPLAMSVVYPDIYDPETKR